MVSKASVRLIGGKQVHVRVKGKKKYVGMYDSIASAAQAFHLATAKVQGGGSLQPAFSVGRLVYAAGQEGREEAAGSIVSYDWTTDVYKVSVGDGKGGVKVVSTPLPSSEYTVRQKREAGAGGAGAAGAANETSAAGDKEADAGAFRGVRVTQESGKWAAEIKRDGRQVVLVPIYVYTYVYIYDMYTCVCVCVCVCV